MDTFTAEQRSRIMAQIKSTGTTPERRLLALIQQFARRRKFVQNAAELDGSPDFYFPRLRLALFADGCFFHGCPRHCRMPSTNRPYWERKIARNQRRDRTTRRRLRQQGISVWRFWEHELKAAGLPAAARRLQRAVEAAEARR